MTKKITASKNLLFIFFGSNPTGSRTLLTFFISILFSSLMYGQATWTSNWVNYTQTGGSCIQDPDDENPVNTDIWYNATDPCSVKIAFDGSNCFFRIQLRANPANTNAGGFDNNVWYLIMLANASGTHQLTLGLNAKTSSDDYVYVTDPAGSSETIVYRYSTSSYNAMRSVQVGATTNYYLDFQVPISNLAAYWSGFTASTPFKPYYGTSASGSTVVNKDHAICTNTCTVSFATITTATFTSIQGGTLPVEITSFSSKRIPSGVELQWVCATEKNNYGFNVQRSMDGDHWIARGFVPGSGVSNFPTKYRFVDTSIPSDAGILQYRLEQIDRDGTVNYSPSLSINAYRNEQSALRQNFRNPFGGSSESRSPITFISYTVGELSAVRLEIIDLTGRTVAELLDAQQEVGEYIVSFDGTGYPSGKYITRLRINDRIFTKSMLLIQ